MMSTPPLIVESAQGTPLFDDTSDAPPRERGPEEEAFIEEYWNPEGFDALWQTPEWQQFTAGSVWSTSFRRWPAGAVHSEANMVAGEMAVSADRRHVFVRVTGALPICRSAPSCYVSVFIDDGDVRDAILAAWDCGVGGYWTAVDIALRHLGMEV